VRFGDAAGSAAPVVASVITDSPAALAGVHAGDQIVAVDGAGVTQLTEVLNALKAKAPGDTIVLTVIAAPTADPTDPAGQAAPVERSVSVVLGVYEPAV
jgi:S1-C subfamily serine protease